MRRYPKVETLFDRDKETFKVDTSRVRRPEFSAITDWVVTEKIDGTNIRLHFDRDGALDTFQIGGRTDKAEIPPPLFRVLETTCMSIHGAVSEIMGDYGIESYTLFGEGYGPKIQKGGGNYRQDPGFILFDVLVNDRTWLGPLQMVEAAERLGLNHVPILGVNTRPQIVDMCRGGFYSVEADAPQFLAEGIIAVPLEPLYNARGDRVQFKLKHSDFAA